MNGLREWLRGDWTPPAWYTALSALAVTVSLVASLVACNGGTAPGVVTEHPKPVLIGGVMYRHLRVDGKKVNVNKSTYDACPVGASWPDCRDGAK